MLKIWLNINYRDLTSVLICCVGCIILIPASFLLISGPNFAAMSIMGFIVACSFLTISAILDAHSAYLERQINSVAPWMLSGGALFLIASILHWPSWANNPALGTTLSDLGIWLFRFGSLSYLMGNTLLAFRLIKNTQKNGTWKRSDIKTMLAILSFILGSLFFIAGGIIAQSSTADSQLMGHLWLVGSSSFALGGMLSF